MKKVLFLSVAALISTSVVAQNGNPKDPSLENSRKPPPQAFQDCVGKGINAKVDHKTPEGMVPATCVETPDGLAARPNNPPKRN